MASCGCGYRRDKLGRMRRTKTCEKHSTKKGKVRKK